MQSSRIRSNNTTTQSFTNAELEFAFYCSPHQSFQIFATQNSSSALMKPNL